LVTKGAPVIDQAMTLRDEIKPLGAALRAQARQGGGGTRRRPGATRRRCPDGGFFDGQLGGAVVCGDEYGEIGTVYQAAGFDYVGVIRAGGRAAVAINDAVIEQDVDLYVRGTILSQLLAQSVLRTPVFQSCGK
jgi:hypothetical protein